MPIQGLERELERIAHHIPAWEKERRDEIRKLNRDTATLAISQSIDEAKAGFFDLATAVAHLEAVRSDLVENVAMFVTKGESDQPVKVDSSSGGPFDRYEVNVLVTQDGGAHGVPKAADAGLRGAALALSATVPPGS